MAQDPQTPIPWQRSTGMVGSYVSQALGYLAAVAAAMLMFSAELPRWLVIACSVVFALGGGGGVAVGVVNARNRRAKGADPRSPQPAILPTVPPGTGSLLVALLASGALLSLLLCGSGCGPVLTQPQGDATVRSVSLGCDLVREIVRPDVVPVSDATARWANFACGLAEAGAALVVPALTSPPAGAAPLLTASPSRLPEMACAEWGARCARPLSAGAAAGCAEVLGGCQAGEPVRVTGEE